MRKSFNRVLRLLPCLLFFLWAAAGHGELVDRIVAIVNDDAITLSELEEAVAPYARQIRGASYGAEQERQMLFKVRQDMLDRMIDQKLADQESKRLGVSVHDTEVDQRVEQIKKENFFTEEDLKRALAAEGLSLEDYRQKIEEQILRAKIINTEVRSKIAITDEEIQDYYEDHQSEYGEKTKYHLRTILIRVASWEDPQDKASASKSVEAVMEGLKAGIPFDVLARQYSQDITAKDGGDLGWFSIDELAPELQETVRWMKEGDVSPALQTSLGYQILMLENIEGASAKTLQEAKLQIQEKIYRQTVEEKFKAWLEALRKRSYIKVIQ